MSMPDRRSEPYQPKHEGWISLKHTAASKLRRLPRVWQLSHRALRLARACAISLKTMTAVARAKLQGYYSQDFDVDRILWIDPGDIRYATLKEFPITTFKGQVLAGDWDLLEKRFDDLDIYQAIRAVCLEGNPWQATVFYQRTLAAIHQGYILWGCSDQQSFDRRCWDLEQLYQSIQQGGYKTQAELASPCGENGLMRIDEEEVGVSIGRSGDLLFCDGAHRTAIAKLLGLQKIPVKVAVRHAGWAEFRKGLLQYSQKRGAKRMQPAPHPDLEDIPHHLEYARLLEAIWQDLPISSGVILDVGAQLGYFCHGLEEHGLECYALEERPAEQSFLRTLHQAGQRQFKIIAGPLASFKPPPSVYFEAVLILDLLYPDKNQPEKLSELLACLRRLAFQRLYVFDEGGQEVPDHSRLAALASQLDLNVARPLVQTADGNTLYVLAKSIMG